MRKSFFNSILLRLFLITGLFILFLTTKAQSTNTKKIIPPFSIELTNHEHFNSTQLKKNKPTMLVYFEPNCGHCQLFTVDLLSSIKDFANVQIVMISYQPINDLIGFQQTFNMNKFSNIKVGTEGYTFLVQKYYSIQKFPFVAVFNKNGKLVSSYRERPSMTELIDAVKHE